MNINEKAKRLVANLFEDHDDHDDLNDIECAGVYQDNPEFGVPPEAVERVVAELDRRGIAHEPPSQLDRNSGYCIIMFPSDREACFGEKVVRQLCAKEIEAGEGAWSEWKLE